MKILDRYIAGTVIGGTLMALLVLGSLLAFVDFVGELSDVGQAAYTLGSAFIYVLLGLPGHMYELFPTAVLIGSLLSLGALASSNELVAMRAAGISVATISRWVLQAGLFLALLVAITGEYLVPLSERQAQSVHASALKQNITLGGKHGFWIRDGDRYLHARRVYPDMKLGMVFIYELDENKHLQRVTYAQSAAYADDNWSLRNVQRTIFDESGIKTEQQNKIEWPNLLNPDLFSVLSVKPENMSATDLYRYSEYLQSNELDASQYTLAFWIKIVTPLASVAMLMIALPFVFGSQRSGSAGARMLIGLLIGIGFFIANKAMNHAGQVYGLAPLV
ncbi:MAG: Lipopolysaccharide export system permease protein LptG, partial [Pseudomonadota bacterium]|nr:Lipopolysaccharide export system permease protein LptG [Pseudomonadota bacterium]